MGAPDVWVGFYVWATRPTRPIPTQMNLGAWAARFRRLARDQERLATTLGTFHFLAFACLMIANLSNYSTKVHNSL